MHSSLAFTDPTAYMRALNDKGFAQQVELAKAAIEFVSVIKRVRGEALEDAAQRRAAADRGTGAD